jgi:GH25 family lysozyme M1 (1,4-beta-N-acetylmuramidase)
MAEASSPKSAPRWPGATRAVAVVAAVVAGVLVLVGGAPAVRAAPPPAGYPIIGLDVSAFQGNVDRPSVAARGALFAYARASEQANIPDSSFNANYHGAKSNGLFAGAYHRARPDVSGGRAQANYFLDQAQYVRDGRTLPPMLDIEWPRSTWTGLDACYNMAPGQLVAWIREFVDQVSVRTGQLAMIYTNPNWWGPCTGNNTSFGAHPLYNSGYLASPPPPPAGWATWTFWQYDDEGIFPGGQDAFNGDYAALQRLAGGIPLSIGLRAAVNNSYVVAESAGSSPLIANRTSIGAWERFYVVDVGNGYVALRSNVNGRFVTAENGGGSALVANRAVVGDWEKFQIVNNDDGTLSLRANANGRYVTADRQPDRRQPLGEVHPGGAVERDQLPRRRQRSLRRGGERRELGAHRQPDRRQHVGAVRSRRRRRWRRGAAVEGERAVRDSRERRCSAADRQPSGCEHLGAVPARRQLGRPRRPARQRERQVCHRGERRRFTAHRQPDRGRLVGAVPARRWVTLTELS